jgi:hypothetical protein
MSASYKFDWRTSLRKFIEEMQKLEIEEIERIDRSENEVQVDW